MIYGIATVLPRVISFILNPLFVLTLNDKKDMGEVTIIFSYLVFFNVLLSYGMETAFFRFYNLEKDKKKVISTATLSLLWTTLGFLTMALLFRKTLADWSSIDVKYVTYTIWILAFDALVIIPFSKLRAEQKPLRYAVIKIANVSINLLLNVFFLVVLPQLATLDNSLFNFIYFENFQIGYIFISNLIASAFTFLVLIKNYTSLVWELDFALWRRMFRYSFPVLIAGIAFAINEHFDKILLELLGVSKADIGAYGACYKIGLFMVLFRTAYTLGIEPFFFSYADKVDAPKTYAMITKYFVIFGSLMSLVVIAFIDVLKLFLVPRSEYWNAIEVVPLIVIANFFLGIYTNLSVWYKLIDKTRIGAYISIVGALVTLVLNFLLIPKIGFYGSAIATVAAYGSMMYISFRLGQEKYPIPYDIPKISLYLGASIVLSAVAFYIPFFRENVFLRIAIILLFFGLLYKNEKHVLLKLIRFRK